MNHDRLLSQILALTLGVLLLVACGTPRLEEARTVEAGGFSFRPIVGFDVETKGAQGTMVSQDEKFKIVLEGRTTCDEVKPLQDAVGEVVAMFMSRPQDRAGEPCTINIAAKEGLAVDVAGTHWLYHETWRGDFPCSYEKGKGRVVVVAAGDFQYLFAFALVADGNGGARWGKKEEGMLNAVINSVTFSEPTGVSGVLPLPWFVNHPQPVWTVNLDGFSDAGCVFDEYGRGTCRNDGPLADVGCVRIEAATDLLGALSPSYPIVRCMDAGARGLGAEFVATGGYSYTAAGDFFYIVGCEVNSGVQYVIVRDDEFVLIETEDEFRQLFAPIESADEALSYALAVTGLEAYYGLELDLSAVYFVDNIEDTHVETVADGYLVQLDQRTICGCGRKPITAVEFHITPQGHITQLNREAVYEWPALNCLCID